MRRYHYLLVVSLAVAAQAACAKPRPVTEIALPTLVPPTAPDREIADYPDEPLPTTTPSPSQAAMSPPQSKPAPRPTTRPELPKPAAEPEVARPEEQRAAAPGLKIAPAAPGVVSEVEFNIRQLLDEAERSLSKVAVLYSSLSDDRKAQYDSAKSFLTQAAESLRASNLAFASKLAVKAKTMADVLVR